MAVADDLPQLDCGRTIEEVWAGLGRPPDQHERSCEHCRQARTDLQRLQDAVNSEHRLSDDTDEPSGRVKTAIMDIARQEIRQGRRIPLEQQVQPEQQIQPEDPELAITERAVTEVVLAAADDVDAVRARRVRVTPITQNGPATLDTGSSEPPAARIALSVTVSVRADSAILDVIEILRDRIAGRVTGRTGLELDRVDISVEDVHDD
ncbi:hypothetical protein [Microlunatus soli]|uniref:Asp23 family, cell envelope-related function n=1 Tax=Microlunatus soli TaxID=630515 RepID=A0A1H1XEA2_9ACTN|nr:hypothetical protein [Microlunatus soli]SDT07578.1 hypothetical protein SAMN04489812_4047 [Microlunatus soli]